MKILLVDVTVVGQSVLAKRIQAFDEAEHELLNIEVSLCDPDSCLSKVGEVDLVILGSELRERGPALARQIRERRNDIEVIVFVTEHDYSSGVFRLAHGARARKVLPDTAQNLDLLQELINLHEEACATGKMRRGKLISVIQAKGGVGATTLTAALGEAFSERGARTALWDLDIETFDLSRSLNAAGRGNKMLSDLFAGTREPTRATVLETLVPLTKNGFILPAPNDILLGNRMVGNDDSVYVSERIANLLRFTNDYVIVDLAGRLGSQSLALLKASDAVLLVVDDSMLGMTAIRSLLSAFIHLQQTPNVYLVGSGTKVTMKQLAESAQISDLVSDMALELPVVPFDPAAARWPGQGKTLYSMGSRGTVKALSGIVEMLNSFLEGKVVRLPRSGQTGEAIAGEGGIARRILEKVALKSLR